MQINLNYLVCSPYCSLINRKVRRVLHSTNSSSFSRFVPFASFLDSPHIPPQLFEYKWELSSVSIQPRLEIRKNRLSIPYSFKHFIVAAVQLHYVTAVVKKQLTLEVSEK